MSALPEGEAGHELKPVETYLTYSRVRGGPCGPGRSCPGPKRAMPPAFPVRSCSMRWSWAVAPSRPSSEPLMKVREAG
jgi:hypothetical protein